MKTFNLALALLASASAVVAQSAQPAPTQFPADIQNALNSFQGQIINVKYDIARHRDRYNTSTDYSSTGRALDYYLRNYFLPDGPSSCPQANQPLPTPAKNRGEGIAYLQKTQLALIDVSQDAINKKFRQGIFDFCNAIRQYGGAANSF